MSTLQKWQSHHIKEFPTTTGSRTGLGALTQRYQALEATKALESEVYEVLGYTQVDNQWVGGAASVTDAEQRGPMLLTYSIALQWFGAFDYIQPFVIQDDSGAAYTDNQIISPTYGIGYQWNSPKLHMMDHDTIWGHCYAEGVMRVDTDSLPGLTRKYAAGAMFLSSAASGDATINFSIGISLHAEDKLIFQPSK